MQPSDLNPPLPYSAWTPGQWELITRLASSDKRILLLEAPTGTGKSAIAVGLARLLGGRSIFLTGTKQLQDQYAETFTPDMLTARGRSNFPCLQEPGVDASQAICTVGGSKNPACPYYVQRDIALKAPEAVLNYSYWFYQANYARRFIQPNLLVCDEAHTLEDEVRKFATVTLRRRAASELYDCPPWPVNADTYTLDDWAAWAADAQAALKWEYLDLKKSGSTADMQHIKNIRSIYDACHTLLSPGMPEDGWVPKLIPTGVEFRPVWVQPLMPKLVTQHWPGPDGKILLMSATILSAELFAHQLGLPLREIDFIRAPSVFPRENRPLYYAPVGKVGRSQPDSHDRVVRAVDDILDAHPGARGIVHTVSYKLGQHLLRNSRHKRRLLSHDSRDRAAKLNLFRSRAGEGMVLVSPSMNTGVDLPYDLLRFQVIAKLAFPDLGDGQIKKRMKLGPDGEPDPTGQLWYNWATACSLIQAYGRGVRAEDDSCVSYLLDGNWGWFRHAVRDMLPVWFTEAIISRPAQADPTAEEIIAQIRGTHTPATPPPVLHPMLTA